MASSYRLSMMMMLRRTNYLCSSVISSMSWRSQLSSYPISSTNYNSTGYRCASTRRYISSTIHTHANNSRTKSDNDKVEKINIVGSKSSSTQVYHRNESSTTTATIDDIKITTDDTKISTSAPDDAAAATDPHTPVIQPTSRHKTTGVPQKQKEVIKVATKGVDPHPPATGKQVVVDEKMVANVLSAYNSSDNRTTALSAEDAVEACVQAWRGQMKLSIRQLCTLIEVCNDHRAYHKDLYHVAYWAYQQLRKESRALSIETYENILSLCTANRAIDDASTVLKHFEEDGYSYTSSVYQSMVRLLSSEKTTTPEVGR